MPAIVPRYFDYLIDGYHRGDTGRFVHLGHWDHPPSADIDLTQDAFSLAQLRLDEILLDLAGINDGLSILDAGCGFGGTLERINELYSHMKLTGINIDTRQLEICGLLESKNNNIITWQLADACVMPFPDESFDRLLCIEAMFHFSSRRKFFNEAARILKPEGIMVASDIILNNDSDMGKLSCTEIESIICREYGPWPDCGNKDVDHRLLAGNASLQCSHYYDATINTRPSHIFTAPRDADVDTADGAGLAALLLKRLHHSNQLKYLYMRFEKH